MIKMSILILGEEKDVYKRQGHGRSDGEKTYYNDFNEMLDDVNVIVDMTICENQNLPVFLLGHSMGCLLYTSK